MPAGKIDAKEPAVRLPIFCDTRPLMERQPNVEPLFVGDSGMIRYLSGGAGCSSAERS
jgi:hypothetical protein